MSAWACGSRSSITLADQWSIGMMSGFTRRVATMVISLHTISPPSTWSVYGENCSLAAPIVATWDDDGEKFLALWVGETKRSAREHIAHRTEIITTDAEEKWGELSSGLAIQFIHSFDRWPVSKLLILTPDGCPSATFDTCWYLYSRQISWPRNFQIGRHIVYRNIFRVTIYDLQCLVCQADGEFFTGNLFVTGKNHRIAWHLWYELNYWTK